MTYRILRKAGGLRNGAERGKGTVWHAVEGGYDTSPALCGESPAIMWSSGEGDAVTCKRCGVRLVRRDFIKLGERS